MPYLTNNIANSWLNLSAAIYVDKYHFVLFTSNSLDFFSYTYILLFEFSLIHLFSLLSVIQVLLKEYKFA